MRQRVVFLVYADLEADSLRGMDAVTYTAVSIATPLISALPCYRPSVSLASFEYSPRSDDREVFVVSVDLNPSPGEMHSKESAQNAIRNILRDAIGKYNPVVSLAPAEIQSTQNEGITQA